MGGLPRYFKELTLSWTDNADETKDGAATRYEAYLQKEYDEVIDIAFEVRMTRIGHAILWEAEENWCEMGREHIIRHERNFATPEAAMMFLEHGALKELQRRTKHYLKAINCLRMFRYPTAEAELRAIKKTRG